MGVRIFYYHTVLFGKMHVYAMGPTMPLQYFTMFRCGPVFGSTTSLLVLVHSSTFAGTYYLVPSSTYPGTHAVIVHGSTPRPERSLVQVSSSTRAC